MEKVRKTVALIGANGYIGRNLSHFLLEKGYRVMNYDIQDKPEYPWMDYEQLDVREIDEFNKVSKTNDYILFFSAITGTWAGFENYKSYIDVNDIGLANLLSFVKNNCPHSKIIFPSTRLVYKGLENELLNEESPKEPKTIYALNKIFGEQLLKLYSDIFNINYTVFRICVPYGNFVGGDLSYGTIGFFLKQIKQNNEITLFGDGLLKRTFTNILDICTLIESTMINEMSNNEIYNIGGDSFSLNDIANLISSKFPNSLVKYVPWKENDLKIESGDTLFDSNKINSINNHFTYLSFNDWLNDTVE